MSDRFGFRSFPSSISELPSYPFTFGACTLRYTKASCRAAVHGTVHAIKQRSTEDRPMDRMDRSTLEVGGPLDSGSRTSDTNAPLVLRALGPDRPVVLSWLLSKPDDFDPVLRRTENRRRGQPSQGGQSASKPASPDRNRTERKGGD